MIQRRFDSFLHTSTKLTLDHGPDAVDCVCALKRIAIKVIYTHNRLPFGLNSIWRVVHCAHTWSASLKTHWQAAKDSEWQIEMDITASEMQSDKPEFINVSKEVNYRRFGIGQFLRRPKAK